MNASYADYVAKVLSPYLAATKRAIPARPAPAPISGRRVLMVTPHPDDECINGGLALRLRRECGDEVYNFPFSFGSDESQRPRRRGELARALARLDFRPAPADDLDASIRALTPALVIFPHARDGHPTHERTHADTVAALARVGYDGAAALWEFWHPNPAPNLLVEIHADDCATLVAATAEHAGEVARNPYHLRLPYWMMENTRRGSELILGNRADTNAVILSTLYEWKAFKGGREASRGANRVLRASDPIAQVFEG